MYSSFSLCLLHCIDIESKGSQTYSPAHVINIDIQDNLDEATFGSFLFCEMCEMVRGTKRERREEAELFYDKIFKMRKPNWLSLIHAVPNESL